MDLQFYLNLVIGTTFRIYSAGEGIVNFGTVWLQSTLTTTGIFLNSGLEVIIFLEQLPRHFTFALKRAYDQSLEPLSLGMVQDLLNLFLNTPFPRYWPSASPSLMVQKPSLVNPNLRSSGKLAVDFFI